MNKKLEDLETVKEELTEDLAKVICIVYAVDDEDTLDSVTDHLVTIVVCIVYAVDDENTLNSVTDHLHGKGVKDIFMECAKDDDVWKSKSEPILQVNRL